jgi:hypothetical protein
MFKLYAASLAGCPELIIINHAIIYRWKRNFSNCVFCITVCSISAESSSLCFHRLLCCRMVSSHTCSGLRDCSDNVKRRSETASLLQHHWRASCRTGDRWVLQTQHGGGRPAVTGNTGQDLASPAVIMQAVLSQETGMSYSLCQTTKMIKEEFARIMLLLSENPNLLACRNESS